MSKNPGVNLPGRRAPNAPAVGPGRRRPLAGLIAAAALAGIAVAVAFTVFITALTSTRNADGTGAGAVGQWWNPGSHNLTADDWFSVARSVATLFGVVGALVLAALAYRRQTTSEDQHDLDRERRRDERAVDLRTRFGTATEQLGNDSAAVRLAGIYALAQVADDWAAEDPTASNGQVQQCIDVLCAYYRLPVEPDSDRAKNGDGEVRATVIRVITAHLQNPDTETTWCGRDLDFTGAVFDRNVSFIGANFTGGRVNFYRTIFASEVDFSKSSFSGAKVSFYNATFPKGGGAYFYDATFSDGEVMFVGVLFTGANVSFANATFTGGSVKFFATHFHARGVNFKGAHFLSGCTVDFSGPLSWSNPPAMGWQSGDSTPDGVKPDRWPEPYVDPGSVSSSVQSVSADQVTVMRPFSGFDFPPGA